MSIHREGRGMSSIGNMNGKWGWLFKIALATYPVVIASLMAFCVWVVSSIHSHELDLANRPTRPEVQAVVDGTGPYMNDRRYILESLTDIKASVQRLEGKLQ